MDWVAVDWGTTNLRAWAMEGGRAVAEASSDRGMATLEPHEFEGALRELIGGWGELPVVACGMVGARQGWVEAPYAPVPGPPLAARPVRAPGGMDVRIVPGLSQSSPPDVMRGEETKLAGLLALRPGWDGTVLMPGTHPKWAALSAGEVTGFRSALTGELMALLAQHSTLRHALGTGWDEGAFLEAVADAMARPEQLLSRLFGVRAASLVAGLGPDAARSRLSGLLVGSDLAGARGWWLGQPVVVLGAGGAARAYAAALRAQGAAVEEADATDATLAGLAEARRRWA